MLPLAQLLAFWKETDAPAPADDARDAVAAAMASVRNARGAEGWAAAIDALRRDGGPAAVEALGRFLRAPHARAEARQQALVALGRIGTPDAVAAIADFEAWAEHRRGQPEESPFGPRDGLFGDAGTEVMPTACLTDGDGATWAIYREPGALWGGDWRVTHAADGHIWAEPVLVGPTEDPEGLLRAIVEGRCALDDFRRDADGDGLTDLEEGRLGTDPHRADSDGDARPDRLDGCPLTCRTPRDQEASIRQAAFTLLFATCDCRDALLVPHAKPFARQEFDGYIGWVLPTPAVRPGWYHVTSMRIRHTAADEAEVCVVGYGAGDARITIVQVACKHGHWVPVGCCVVGE